MNHEKEYSKTDAAGCDVRRIKSLSTEGHFLPESALKEISREPHTVKPTDLMRYLCRLVTPPGGVVLDPFTGSGSTGKAATLEGFRFIGCELYGEYADIAEARIRDAFESLKASRTTSDNAPTTGDLFEAA